VTARDPEFVPLTSRLRNLLLGLWALVVTAPSASRRRLWAELREYERRLPERLAAPLPQVLAAQTPASPDLNLPADQVRLLADAAALASRPARLTGR